MPRRGTPVKLPFPVPRHGARLKRPRAFSLLELLLALSLTVIVLVLVNMAVDLHLRSLDTRRMQLEESLLARSILRMIADDIRGSVQHFEQDTSGIEALLQQSVASAAGSLGEAAAAATGSSAGGTSAGGASGTGGALGSGGATGAGSTSGSGASAGGSQSSSGRSTSTASSTSGSGSSSGTSSTSSSTSGASSTSSTSSSGEPTENTEDLSSATIPAVPGLFGNQYQLQMDVSRLPRVEDYQRYLTPDAATSVVDVPSDLKTVTYFVQSSLPSAVASSPSQSLEDLTDPMTAGSGLVRRELDRSVTLWAINNGNYTGLQGSGEIIAPEVVAIEFQYFDGSQFLTQWDSEAEKKLPIAILVILALRAPGTDPATATVTTSLTAEPTANVHLYRLLVYLPSGGQEAPEASSMSSGSSSETTTAGSESATGGTP